VQCWLSSRPCLCVFLLLTVAFCFLFSFVPLPFFLFFSLLFPVLFLSFFRRRPPPFRLVKGLYSLITTLI
jgi:hypothetical protein